MAIMGKNPSIFMEPYKLGEPGQADVPDRVQLLKSGSFYDPRYGKFDITKQMLLAMVNNWKSNIRKVDLSIDYAHENEKEAAGWMTDVYLSDDGEELWAKVKWTVDGAKMLADRKYRYLSAEFHPDYQDNETQKKHGPTLLGAGLTNRPVIKGMTPAVELSEGDKMKTVEELTKLVEDQAATIKKLSDSVDEMKKKAPISQPAGDNNAAGGGADNGDDDGDGDDDSPAGQIKKLKKNLADLQGKHDEMAKKYADQEAEMAEMKKSKAMAEKESKFSKMLSEGKAVAAQKEAFLSGDMEKFMELAQPVKFSEMGHGRDAGASVMDEKDPKVAAQREITKLAEEKVKAKSAKDLVSAMAMVLSERSDLRKAYEG